MKRDKKYHIEYRVYEMLREGSDYMWVGDILYVHLEWEWRYKRQDRRDRKRAMKGKGEGWRRARLFLTKCIRSKVKQEQPVFLLPLLDAQLGHVEPLPFSFTA